MTTETHGNSFTKKAFFDTNLFIYALDSGIEDARIAMEEHIASDSICTSVITLMEFGAGAHRKAGEIGLLAFQDFLKQNYIKVYPITPEVAVEAAILRSSNKSLKSLDALQLATAADSHCSIFYTNDKKLQKIKIPDLEVRGI